MTVGTAVLTDLQAVRDLEALRDLCLREFSPAPGEQAVFGEGPAHARLLLIGEAPGKQEAESGRPFVGNAGRLLNKYLQEASIRREEAYLTNVVKIRPPGNRTPRISEVKDALPVLLRQIELVGPRIIVCLGSVAVQAVLDPKAKITEIRGQWQEKDGIRVMPTYHPSAVFRDEDKRDLLKQDLREVGAALR
ncbi:uracil-DNA glycosylase [Cohnella sp. CFH 77786]|uniref:uracil-DNA glycosylase n=1 Tax=Cohnella sp. CFH 77786 TaxID=2662265 RepID=UPI001C61090A|nr:uracil-DNA glycosylase [Cohnella sp. CFH 77786]MBW5447561.1 uracil-DNA glycosylase [Cohnella sp. CFH 77786]